VRQLTFIYTPNTYFTYPKRTFIDIKHDIKHLIHESYCMSRIATYLQYSNISKFMYLIHIYNVKCCAGWVSTGPDFFCSVFGLTITIREKNTVNSVLTSIKNLWDSFIENYKYYSPSTNCTVDEQLLDFCGRFKARVYISNKFDKYGIKIVSCMINAETIYWASNNVRQCAILYEEIDGINP